MVELLTRGSRRHGLSRALVPGSRRHFTGLRKTMAFLLVLFACFAGPMSQAAHATSTVDQFVANTIGHELSNAQGTFPGECVSLVSQYLLQVHGITTGAWGNAIDYQAGGSGGNHLSDNGFSWSTDQSFANGDILVWGQNAGAGTGPYGHVGIWYGGKVYDQNDGRHSPAIVAGYSTFWTGGYLGHWRKGTVTPPFTVSAKSSFSTGEHIVINWSSWPGATKYGLTVWKPPYSNDAGVVWDNYVWGNSQDIGTLPAGTYQIHMAAYTGSTLSTLSNYLDFTVVDQPANTYALTYAAGSGGTISGTSPQTVPSGGSGTAVTAVANSGYHFVNWSDGSTANPRTDTNVTANMNVTANFAANPITTYTLTYLAGYHGTVFGNLSQTVNSGGSGTAVTAYHFVNWSDGSTANPRTDANVTANMNVTANFASPLAVSIVKSPAGNAYTVHRYRGVASWTFGGQMTASNGPVTRTRIMLQTSANGRNWSNCIQLRTDSSGKVSIVVTWKKAGTCYLRWSFAGDDGWYLPATSTATKVTIK